MNKKDEQLYSIQEQGDMGLGFNPLSEEETRVIKENEQSNNKKDKREK